MDVYEVSFFSAGVQVPIPVATLLVQKTPTE